MMSVRPANSRAVFGSMKRNSSHVDSHRPARLAKTPAGGLRLGTVRRPPVASRPVRITRFLYVWLPNLAPTETLVKSGQNADNDRALSRFERAFLAEMKKPDASKLLDFIAALSHRTNLSIGCYCANEDRCHRSVLRQLLQQRGADIV
jgi:uncharacterized protein YeaO (DUF488 family)